jgi:hypothetical protein
MNRPIVVEWTREQVKYGIVELRIPIEGDRPVKVYSQWAPELGRWFELVRKRAAGESKSIAH